MESKLVDLIRSRIIELQESLKVVTDEYETEQVKQALAGNYSMLVSMGHSLSVLDAVEV